MDIHENLRCSRIYAIALAFVVLVLSTPVNAKDQNKVEMRTLIDQYYGAYPSHPGLEENGDFKLLVDEKCNGAQRTSIAGIQLGAILLDWIAGRAVSAVNKKLDRYVKEHAVSYSNEPHYYDMGDRNLWGPKPSEETSDPKNLVTCVVVRRIHCPRGTKGPAGCKTHLGFAAHIREESNALRVLPIALSVKGLEARHSKGNATVAINFEIQAISPSPQGGQWWSSGSVPLVAEEFDADKSNPKKNEYGTKSHLVGFEDTPWEGAAVIPLPPGMARPNTVKDESLTTFRITVAEVGRPSAFGSRLADLLSTKEDDLSGALGSALKKAAGIKEE